MATHIKCGRLFDGLGETALADRTIVAQDGSWTTGRLDPAEVAGVTFDKPGTYTYICKEHPWAKAQIIVTP